MIALLRRIAIVCVVVYLLTLDGIVKGLVSVAFSAFLAYVVWRALPAMRADWAAIRSRAPRRQSRSRRGAYL